MMCREIKYIIAVSCLWSFLVFFKSLSPSNGIMWHPVRVWRNSARRHLMASERLRSCLRAFFSLYCERGSKNCAVVRTQGPGGACVSIMVLAGKLSLHVHWVSPTTPWQGKLASRIPEAASELGTESWLVVCVWSRGGDPAEWKSWRLKFSVNTRRFKKNKNVLVCWFIRQDASVGAITQNALQGRAKSASMGPSVHCSWTETFLTRISVILCVFLYFLK